MLMKEGTGFDAPGARAAPHLGEVDEARLAHRAADADERRHGVRRAVRDGVLELRIRARTRAADGRLRVAARAAARVVARPETAALAREEVLDDGVDRLEPRLSVVEEVEDGEGIVRRDRCERTARAGRAAARPRIGLGECGRG